MNPLIFIPLILLLSNLPIQETIEVDYVKGNINKRKHYYQVPTDELLFIKYQALEPLFLFERKTRGQGVFDPLINAYVLNLRDNGVTTYVDYLTPAKAVFYQNHPNYDICRPILRSFNIYKDLVKENRKHDFKHEGKFTDYSIPYNIGDKYGIFAMTTSKLKLIEKHKYPNTDIYNIKSLLDDEDFYTIQINNIGSAIVRYIYLDGEAATKRNPKYSRDRVYEFVASTAEQITLMLKGRRMDWVDISAWGDYYIQKLGIKGNTMTVLKFSHVPPAELSINDYQINAMRCTMKKKDQLEKVMKLIDIQARKIRGNKDFFTKMLQNYSKKFNVPYVAPEDFFYTKGGFDKTYDLRRGDFDLP